MKLNGPVRALGAMSDPALDGVTAAMVETDGEVIVGFGETGHRPYSDTERTALAAAIGRWPGEAGIDAAEEAVEAAHVALLSDFGAAALVGFHGVTLAHDPQARGSHQAGDGARLAERLGRPVAWDYRTADVALGGAGAPLSAFFHAALAKWLGAAAPLAFLDLGPVGSLTWVDPSKDRPEEAGALLAFETGPALAPLAALMRARPGLRDDESGALVASGAADERVVASVLAHPYFFRIPPKALDTGAFADLTAEVAALSDADAAATLTACAVAAVANGIAHCPSPPERLLVSGAGRHNAPLMAGLAAALPMPVAPVEAVGLDGDALEAQAMAFLAVRIARGLPTTCPSTTGVAAAVGGGIISDPA
jgi:anhydro-N-acetylmuramic acid kinase